ncbi:MAG: prepilin-type N-terminal cleavage/methylation domain-containing protein [Planctomycetota bacterium]
MNDISGLPNYRLRGFTLIELLVVISIIALLIGILLPTLATTRHQARVTADLTQLQQIKVANAAYTADYDGYYPVAFRLTGPTGNQFNIGIAEQLIPYLSSTYTYTQNEAYNTQYYEFSDQASDVGSIWESPVDTLETRFLPEITKRSYAINQAEGAGSNGFQQRTRNGVSLQIDVTGPDLTPTATTAGFSKRIEEVLSASDSIDYLPNFAELHFVGWNAGSEINSFELFANSRSHTIHAPWASSPNRFYGYAGPGAEPGQDPRDMNANFAFADGHASNIRAGDILNPDEPPTTIFSDGRALMNCEKR